MAKRAAVPVLEKDIQRAILDYLRAHKVFCWRNNTGAMFGEHKGKRWAVRFGFPGISDIVGIVPTAVTFSGPGRIESSTAEFRFREGYMRFGRFFAIEVKAPKGKETPDQSAFISEILAAGGIAGVCRSVEDAKELLGL